MQHLYLHQICTYVQFISEAVSGFQDFSIVKYECNYEICYSNVCPTSCNVTQFILSENCSPCFGWYQFMMNN